MRRAALLSLCLVVAACGGGTSGVETTACSAAVTFPEYSGQTVFKHVIYRYPDGGVMTTCEALNPVSGTSWFVLYRPKQEHYNEALCGVVYDIDTNSGNPNGGAWYFSTDASGSRAVFIDPGSTWNGRTVPLTCQKVP